MNYLLEYHMEILLFILIFYYFIDIYKFFFYTKLNTDKVDMLARWVELKRLQKAAIDPFHVLNTRRN